MQGYVVYTIRCVRFAIPGNKGTCDPKLLTPEVDNGHFVVHDQSLTLVCDRGFEIIGTPYRCINDQIWVGDESCISKST